MLSVSIEKPIIKSLEMYSVQIPQLFISSPLS